MIAIRIWLILISILCYCSVHKAGDWHAFLPVNNFADSTAPGKLSLKQLVVPVSLVILGSTCLWLDASRQLNHRVRQSVYIDHPHSQVHIDDYLVFAPGAATLGLTALGVRSEHSLADQAVIYTMSVGLAGTFVFPVKWITHETRPDGSNDHSFPSGHTATAFASAEFMRREFRHTSPWLGVAGYTVATGVGFLRVYNNRHWLTDVVAGAGFGIFSTTLAYWVHDKIWPHNINHLAVTPYYSGGAFGVALALQWPE